MQEYKEMKLPNGSKLIRQGRKRREMWVYENNALCTTEFYLYIKNSNEEENSGIIMNNDEDLVEIDCSRL